MYLCGICGECSKPRQQRYTYAIYRCVPAGTQKHRVGKGENQNFVVIESPPRQEIAKEIAVCKRCYGMLCQGFSVEQVRITSMLDQEQQERDLTTAFNELKKRKPQEWVAQAIPLRSIK